MWFTPPTRACCYAIECESLLITHHNNIFMPILFSVQDPEDGSAVGCLSLDPGHQAGGASEARHT